MTLSARILLVIVTGLLGSAAAATAQSGGSFTSTGNMIAGRLQHSATLLPDRRVLMAGGASSNGSGLASTELYDPDAATFRAGPPMIVGRRMHTATLLPDDRVLIVGGYDAANALASAELFDPATGTFSPTGSLIHARGGHTAILLSTGKVLIVGGYGTRAYPEVGPAELYDPASGTFSDAGAYVGRGGCDFCAPSVLLSGGSVLFPWQYPAQEYDPTRDSFSPAGMMIYDQSTAALLTNGQVLFAGGAPIGRIADAELYNPATRTFAATGSMAWRRVWHTLTPLPNGMVLAAGGETDTCSGNACWFAGSIAATELYDVPTGAFFPGASLIGARGSHTATLLNDGKVLVAGGVWYGGIGIYGGSLSTAELYTPDVLVAAPALGAVFHEGTNHLVSADDPATAGESIDIYCTGLTAGSVIPPQVAIGGRMAAVLRVSKAPGMAGVDQVRVRVPGGVTPGPAVRVRLTYLARPSNAVTIGVR